MTTETLPQAPPAPGAAPVAVPLAVRRLFRSLAAPGRYRVLRDAEGFPMIPGRLGRIEWHCDGVDCHGCPARGGLLAVWTDRPRLFAKVWAVPGVLRWQTGDQEMRALFPVEALDQVAGVIGARRRRRISPEHLAKLQAGLLQAGSGVADDEEPDDEGEDSSPVDSRDETPSLWSLRGAEALAPSWVREWFGRIAAPSGEGPAPELAPEAAPAVRVVFRAGQLLLGEPEPFPGWRAARTEVLKRDGYRCRRCRTRQGPWTIHHVIPRSQGGSDDPRNLVALCSPCHDQAGPLAEAGAPMGTQLVPAAGPSSARARLAPGARSA